MIYRDDTLELVRAALEECSMEHTNPEPDTDDPSYDASNLIKTLLEEKNTVVCSLPPPMLALLKCLYETGLWGLTIEEVLERLAANELRRMLEDSVQANEWFPGGIHNIVDGYSKAEEDESEVPA